MKFFVSLLLFAALSVTPAPAADPLSSLRFLVGSWKCTYQAGKTHVYYKATYSYDLARTWLRESDSSSGGSDLAMITYSPKAHGWTSIVIEPDRSAVVFFGAGNNPNQIVYRSVYPDAASTDVFDRKSPISYTLHFSERHGGRTMQSHDVCVKT